MADVEKKVGGLSKTLAGLGGAAMGASEMIGGGLLAGAAAGGAALVGMAAAGIGAASDIIQSQDQLQSSLGVSAETAAKLGEVGKQVFTDNWGGSIAETTAGVGKMVQAFQFDIPMDELKGVTEQAFAMQTAFGQEMPDTIRMLQGTMGAFGNDGAKVMDVLAKSIQVTGDPAGDLLDTFSEYGGLFADAGFSAEQMGGLLASGLGAGAFNADKVADGVKEFGIRVRDPAVLNTVNDMGGKLAEWAEGAASGNQTVKESMEDILPVIAAIEDPIERNVAGVAVFGAAWEDLGEDVMLALDTGPLANFEGAALDAGNNVSGGFGGAIETIKRTITTGLGTAFTPLVESARAALPDLMSSVLPAITGIMDSVKGALANVDIGEIFSNIGDAIAGIPWAEIQASVESFIKNGVDKIMAFDWVGLAATVRGVFDKIAGAFKFLADHPSLAKVLGIGVLIIGALAPVAMVLGPLVGIVSTLAGVFGAVAGALGIFGGGAVVAGAGATTGAAGVGLLGAAVAFLTSPIGLVILAVVALIAIGVLLYKHWDTIREACAKTGEKLREIWDGVVAFIKRNADTITNVLLALAGPLGWLVLLWKEKGDEIKALVADAWNWITSTISTAVENIRVGISQGWDRIKEYLTKTLEDLFALVERVWLSITDAIWAALESAQKIIDTVLSWIETTFGVKLDAVKKVVETAFNFIYETFESVLDLIEGVVSAFMLFLHGDFAGGIKTIIDSVVGFFTGMGESVGRAIAGLAEAVRLGIVNVVAKFQPIIDAIEKFTGIDLTQAGTDLIAGLQNGIEAGWAILKGVWNTLMDMIPMGLGEAFKMDSPSKLMAEKGENIVMGLVIGIRSKFGAVREAVSDLVDAIEGAFAAGMNNTFGGRGVVGAIVAHMMTQSGTATMAAGGAAERPGVSSDALMAYIRGASFGGISQAQLAEWMKAQGFDDETIAAYRDLHKMREGGKWKTREAMWLHRRRTVLTGGDWTGGGGMTLGDSAGGLRIGDTGAGVLQPLTTAQNLYATYGQYLPMLQESAAEEAKQRDVTVNPMTDPFVARMPLASQLLPERRQWLTPGPILREEPPKILGVPVSAEFVGAVFRNPTSAESEARRLGMKFSEIGGVSMGDPRADLLMRAAGSDIAFSAIEPLIASKAYLYNDNGLPRDDVDKALIFAKTMEMVRRITNSVVMQHIGTKQREQWTPDEVAFVSMKVKGMLAPRLRDAIKGHGGVLP